MIVNGSLTAVDDAADDIVLKSLGRHAVFLLLLQAISKAVARASTRQSSARTIRR